MAGAWRALAGGGDFLRRARQPPGRTRSWLSARAAATGAAWPLGAHAGNRKVYPMSCIDFAATVEMLNAAKARLSELAAQAEAELAPPSGDDLRRHSGYPCDAAALLAAHRGLAAAIPHLDICLAAIEVLTAHQRAETAGSDPVFEALGDLLALQGQLMDWPPVEGLAQ